MFARVSASCEPNVDSLSAMASVEADGATAEKTSFSAFQNNPNKVLPIAVGSWQTECSTEALQNNQAVFNNIKKIVKTVCPLMEHVAVEDISIRRVTGGLTNMLYLVTGHEKKPVITGQKHTCLVRVHDSKDADVFFDREVENRIFAFLSSAGQAPHYFGRFLDGRVEEFYDDAVPLDPKDMAPTKAQMEHPDKPLCFAFSIARCFGLAVGAHAHILCPLVVVSCVCMSRASEDFVQCLHQAMHDVFVCAFFLFSKLGALHSLRVKDGVCKTKTGQAEVP